MYIPAKLNVALNKECQQSSTFKPHLLKYGPQYAVDGDTSTVIGMEGNVLTLISTKSRTGGQSILDRRIQLTI